MKPKKVKEGFDADRILFSYKEKDTRSKNMCRDKADFSLKIGDSIYVHSRT